MNEASTEAAVVTVIMSGVTPAPDRVEMTVNRHFIIRNYQTGANPLRWAGAQSDPVVSNLVEHHSVGSPMFAPHPRCVPPCEGILLS